MLAKRLNGIHLSRSNAGDKIEAVPSNASTNLLCLQSLNDKTRLNVIQQSQKESNACDKTEGEPTKLRTNP